MSPICVGCGIDIVDGVMAVELSEDPGNAIECRDDGLYTAGADISADACNAIGAHADGLWAPCQRGVADRAQMNSPQNASLPVNPASAGTYGFESDLVSIVNGTCRDVAGIVTVRAGGLYIDTDAGGFFGTGHLDVDIDGAGWTGATPDTSKRVHGASLFADFNNLQENNYLLVTAGDTVTYKARLIVVVDSGSGNLHGAVNFELIWTLVPTAAC